MVAIIYRTTWAQSPFFFNKKIKSLIILFAWHYYFELSLTDIWCIQENLDANFFGSEIKYYYCATTVLNWKMQLLKYLFPPN